MVFVTRTPVADSGFCRPTGMFGGPTVTRTPVGTSYGRPSFASNGWGGHFVTRTPVGSSYCGSSLFGRPYHNYGGSSYQYQYGVPYSRHYNATYQQVDSGAAAATAGVIGGLLIWAALS